ncbi:hypothetical protein Tco_1203116 [Tanacetum coccineum]
MPQPTQNLEDNLDPTTTMNKALALMAKAFKLNTIPTNNKQRSSLISLNSQIAQPDINTSQDIKMQIVDDNVGNQVRQNAMQNDGNEVGQNAVQNPGIQNVENMNGLSVVPEIANQYGNGNVVIGPTEGDGNGINEEEAGIQSTQEEFEFMTTVDAHDETERVNVNCTSEGTLQQASTFETRFDNAPVYDSDGSAEVSKDENCYDHDIFNMLAHEVQYTDLQTELDPNSDSNGFSSTRVNSTAKTRRPHPRSNSNTDKVPSKSKSSFLSNNVEKIEENHRNSQIPKNQKHMPSECDNITLVIRNAKSEIICVMCKQCLVTANHDVCVLKYVNDMNSRADNQSTNASKRENQEKHKENVKKSKELGSKRSLASSRPSKPRTCIRWIPTGRIFSMCGKLTASSNTENKSEKSVCDNASTSNPSEPSSKGFSNSASLLGSSLNRRTKKIMETINVTFDEFSAMAFKQSSLKPGLQSMTSGQISSGLDLPYAPSTTTTQRPTEDKLDLLFEAMYDDHVGGQPSAAPRTVPDAQAPQVLQTPMATTTTIDTAPTPTNSFSQIISIPSTSHNVDELETQQQHGQPHPATIVDNVPNAMFDDNTFANPFATPSTSAAESSSLQYMDPSNMHTFYQPYHHEYQ